MTNTIQQHFGDGVDTSIFDLKMRDYKGNLRHCIGNNMDVNIKWFQFKDIDPRTISFCEYCAKNSFSPKEITEVTNDDIKRTLVCDSMNRKLCEKYHVGDRRCVTKSGIKINVNIVNKDNTDFVPVLLTNEFKDASAHGWLSANLPSGCYYEIAIQGDSNYIYDETNLYKLNITSNGRKIVKSTSDGLTDYYIPMFYNRTSEYHPLKPNIFTIDSYTSGYGDRLFCHVPTDIEKKAKLNADSETGIFRIKIDIGKC